MFSKKKKTAHSGEAKKSNELSNLLGLDMSEEDMVALGIGGIGAVEDDGDSDEGLEDELATLQAENRISQNHRKQRLEALTSEGNSDRDDDDDDVENDVELLAELNSMAPGEENTEVPSTVATSSLSQETDVELLIERETNYKCAIENANKSGQDSKARRYLRGLKQIQNMIKEAKAGKAVNIDELPPPVATEGTSTSSQPTQMQALPTDINVDSRDANLQQALLDAMSEDVHIAQSQDDKRSDETKLSDGERKKAVELSALRRDQYRMAALSCKRAGNIMQAKQFLALSKQINSVVELLEKGEDVDISQLPPAPPTLPVPEKGSQQDQPTGLLQEQSDTSPLPETGRESVQGNTPQQPSVPKNVEEALQQRLEKYQETAEQARKEGNSSKARRMGRIVKQYQDAIKFHKAGKPVSYDELPTPPGYAPIPGVQVADSETPKEDLTEPNEAPAAPAPPHSGPKVASSPSQPGAQRAPSTKIPTGQNEQQLRYLLERQKEFKLAALKSKKKGNVEEAKHYLKMSKGLDKMIQSAQNGLRVDLSSIPPPPFAASDPAPVSDLSFEVVHSEDSEATCRSPEEMLELFSRLENALIKQIEMCRVNAKHYQQLGDVSNTKSFEKMAKNLRHDLDAVQSARKHQDPPPRFHYEDRSFTIVNSFPDLSDSELEINVIRGLNIPLQSGYQPKDMYTYVCFEFPFPSTDDPQTDRTQTIKHSINPEYNEVFKVNIDRKSRSLARMFKRQNVKFEVKYERGFLKGDKALGQVQLKLAPFDKKCEIHDCLDLMDVERGRKAIGGKLELRLRMREPVVEKDVNIEKWKWLVIDLHFTSRKERASTSPNPAASRGQPNSSKVCGLG